MSSQAPQTGAETLAAPAPELAEPLLRPARVLVSARTAQLLAAWGSAGVIFLPVFALVSGAGEPLSRTLVTSLCVTAIWLFALRGAVSAGRVTLNPLGPTVAAAVGTVAGAIVVSALDSWLPVFDLGQRTLLKMAVATFLLTAVWETVVQQSIAARRRVLVVGASEGGSDLVQELTLAERTPFDLVGIVDDERETELVAGVPVHGKVTDLPQIIEAQKPDIVVLAVGEARAEAFNHLLDSASAGFKVVGLPEFYEHAFGRLPVRHLTPTWFMAVLHLYQRPYTRFAKRTFDVIVAGLGLLLTAPLFPIVALLVKQTRGPVVFRQTRLGEGGRPFTIYKFRTMREHAEEPGRPLWAEERDPRVTGVGRFLRMTRLDELPQLWNVLKGDMSIVGPRPERPEFIEVLQEAVPFWTRRHMVKPGITGWAQISHGYTADADSTVDKLSHDLWYLRHRSLVVDLAICAKTFATLLSGSGAR